MPEENKQASFLRDVASHVATVIRDDGVYRHVRFKKPGSSAYYFDLVTWPGYLAYTGDMGCYVFSRTNDMFEFFRDDRPAEGKIRINLGYWSEKLQAVDGNRRAGGAKEFCEEKFAKVIKEDLVRWMREDGLSREDRHELRMAVQEEILDRIGHGDEHATYQLANEFCAEIGGQKFQFEDPWDHDFTEYTSHFVWCCYALAWGIQQYDALKEVVPVAEVDDLAQQYAIRSGEAMAQRDKLASHLEFAVTMLTVAGLSGNAQVAAMRAALAAPSPQ